MIVACGSELATDEKKKIEGKVVFMIEGKERLMYDILAINVDGSNPANLTNDEFYNRKPVLSPDGKKIIFIREEDSQDEIYIMNVDGSNKVNLTNNEAQDRFGTSMRRSSPWSPDSSKIVFTSRRGLDRSENHIYIMDSDGSNIVRLTDNPSRRYSDIRWSPDGNKIAFICGEKERNICAINITGSNDIEVINDQNMVTSFSWSPDGSKLLFIGQQDLEFHLEPELYLFTIDADGTNQKQLTDNLYRQLSTWNYSPSALWSPDGNRIVFTANTKDSGVSIYVMDANGSNVESIVNGISYCNLYDWLPDSNKIFYYAYSDGYCIMDPDGSNRVILSNYCQEYDSPASNINYSLILNIKGEGTVITNPQSSTFKMCESVELTAVPSAGWVFSRWSDLPTQYSQTRSITMNSDKKYTANFVKESIINGKVYYGGKPITQFTTVAANIEYDETIITKAGETLATYEFDVQTRNQDNSDHITYDKSNGTYTVTNLLPGKHVIKASYDTSPPFDGNGFRPGDFRGISFQWNISKSGELYVSDIGVLYNIHLTAPIDNLYEQGYVDDPIKTYHGSDLLFTWESVPDASSYRVTIYLYEEDSREVWKTEILKTEEILLDLPPNSVNQYYSFTVSAYNSDGVKIGRLPILYEDGNWGRYRFRIE